MTYLDLIGVPYTEMKCWDLVATILGMEKLHPESKKDQILVRNTLKQEFIEVHDIELHDVVLQGTHVGIVVPGGILHATDPFSEFIPTSKDNLYKGIQTGYNYPAPKFYRRIK